MYQPTATYRIQFHKEFTFDDLERILPYLRQLGVRTIYASPIFEATPGSNHGYDGLNPHRINPEVGTEEQLRNLSTTLKEHNMGWLQDIVPNHMAFHPKNEWLMDVLEKGPQSFYADFFDVTWTGKVFHGRIMVPFLGAKLEEVIRNGELKAGYDAEQQRMVLRYYDNTYPLNPASYVSILKSEEGATNQALQQLLAQIPEVKAVEDPKKYGEAWNEIRRQLASLMKNEATRTAIEKKLEAINGSPERLQEITGQQIYKLCHWQETDHRINYRRFFTVNGLICLNIQNPAVFEHYHQLIGQLTKEGIFNGLRIDHIDGLFDPTGYLQQLRTLAGEDTYIVVEKILEPGEGLPKYWPIEGNTGYDFLAIVNNLFTNRDAEEAFRDFYENLTGDDTPIHQQLHDKKAYILHHHMAGELNNLYHLLLESDIVTKRAMASVHPDDLKAAIGEFLVQCPVYRYYGNRFPLEGEEAGSVQEILNRIRRYSRNLGRAVNILESVLLHLPHERDEDFRQRVQRFYQRCMQFTGPLMAKGVEDTLMYTYNRFIGHNEVGDAPESFGHTPERFHEMMQDRQARWPLSINATSTHDTKRGEDVRARLNVLTDVPQLWLKQVEEWQAMNTELKKDGAPDANDEYFIYQTLAGAYPLDEEETGSFGSRVEEYLQKALREAKLHSNWTEPDEGYEKAAKQFATGLLDQEKPFWKSFTSFLGSIRDFGIVNSLSQVLLKFTCPGIPDVYQGCEWWDFSLVDPDNRRPIAYEQRMKWLEEVSASMEEGKLLEELWKNRADGRIKFWLVHNLLQLRKSAPDLFAQGEYHPLRVEGKYRDHVLAFARMYKQSWYIIAVPLHLATICTEQGVSLEEVDWKDTRILLPADVTENWEDLLGRTKGKGEKGLRVAELFRTLPLAVLRMQGTNNERGAGLLLHISSLPSAYGIGDMGPEARSFADFLSRSRQKYWQLLPLNPTEAGQGHSPYSSTSSRAGNTLLISPELLVKDGLLDHSDLQAFQRPVADRTDFEEAETIRKELFDRAWKRFGDSGSPLQAEWVAFCDKEKEWLDDFALYMVLKEENGGKPWYEWEEDFKHRETRAIRKLEKEHAETIAKVKWLQFIFARQWKSLKEYCNNKGIRFIGDLPFYISYDSVDVWANRDIFALDEEGNKLGMAGVPPDAFSDDGQLWGMPVFRWEVLKEQNYHWWIGRLQKNRELFDLIRLDHFRAFADYWEVPAGEETARNGSWKPGPGAHFFQAVQTEMGELPFVAEDLGDINEAVLNLRDEFGMPGMNVLQFAFGEDMPDSPYIPHNYINNSLVYTGTHDNNTTTGWYRQEADKGVRERLQQYAGQEVGEGNVHQVLGRLAYASVAGTAILPAQDILGLAENARMNTPSSGENNWSWRMLPGQLTWNAEELLRKWAYLYNRD